MLYRGARLQIGLLQTSLTKSLALVAAVLFAAGMAEAKSENATTKSRFENGQCAAQGACYHSQASNAATSTDPSNSSASEDTASSSDDAGKDLTSPALDVDQSVADSSENMTRLGQGIHSGDDIKNEVVPGFNPSFDYPLLVSLDDDRNVQLVSNASPAQRSWTASLSVPEPATLALLGMGLLVLYMMSQRNKAE